MQLLTTPIGLIEGIWTEFGTRFNVQFMHVKEREQLSVGAMLHVGPHCFHDIKPPLERSTFFWSVLIFVLKRT
jgi:hypothetical protein